MKEIRFVLATFLGTLIVLLALFSTQKGHCAKDLEMREIFSGVYDLGREISQPSEYVKAKIKRSTLPARPRESG